MNYYNTAQRTDGRWIYGCQNRRTGSHAVGYCTSPDFIRNMLDDSQSHYPWTQAEKDEYEADLAAGKYHSDGHATKEEASACFRRYELDHNVRYGTENSQHKCRQCGAWTDKFVEVSHSQLYSLCDEHRTREVLEELVPMPGERWSSY